MGSSGASSPEQNDDPILNDSPLQETVLPVRTNSSTSQTNRSEDRSTDGVPRPKRIACILCRKRKLRCDGNRPSCSTCSRLGHDCAYDEVRRKSGPKRGYVKLLEQRLKQVETMLESRDVPGNTSPEIPSQSNVSFGRENTSNLQPILENEMSDIIPDPTFGDATMPILQDPSIMNDFSWEMIGLGLEEPLPSQDLIDEMTDIFFEKVYPSFPMIHKGRFYSSMNHAPHLRPPVCLRYAMWTHACAVTPKYAGMAEHFYVRARKYAEQEEMKGHGEGLIQLGIVQAWALLGSHEFKMMYFPRAWLSTGRADRMAVLLGLHRLDRIGLDVKLTMPPPTDWTDREERRRTFWMVYCCDRYASIGSGWPMGLDERDILTNLPASENAFNNSQPEPTMLLNDIVRGEGIEKLSSFAAVCLMATIYGRNLTHLHRPDETDDDHDLNGAFWKRHRSLDNILLNFSLAMPSQMRLPAGLHDANAIFTNMNLHTATICLHQAAIFKADRHKLPAQVSGESKRRCIVAADQVANHMRMISHLDMSWTNPFIAFCLYVAARVFIQYLKSRRNDVTVRSQLLFLVGAMQVLQSRNPLTESFLIQMEIDLEGAGLDIQIRRDNNVRLAPELPGSQFNNDNVSCSPIVEIRETQGIGNVQMNSTMRTAQRVPVTHAEHHIQLFGTGNQADITNFTLDNPLLATTYEGIDGVYASQPKETSHISSPGLSSGASTQSRPVSNHPTPSSNSQRGNSYTSFSPTTYNLHFPNESDSLQNAPANKTTTTFNFASNQSGGPPGHNDYFNTTNIIDLNANAPNPTTAQLNNMDFSEMGFTPGATTGMTPMADQMWQGNSMNNGMNGTNDWMFNWNGSPPQQ